MSESVTAFVALGANLGDRSENIRQATEELRRTRGIELIRLSSLLENPSVGGPADAPAFLNGVAQVRTTLTARTLLARLLEIERNLGRVRREKWEPRLIDLDLILYGRQIIDEPDLKVPHPLMNERRFVLAPLAEIAPDFVHPAAQLTIMDLLKRL